MTKHGCYNTKRINWHWVNDGYMTLPSSYEYEKSILAYTKLKCIDDTMTKDCQYAKGVPDDPKCEGCEKKGK